MKKNFLTIILLLIISGFSKSALSFDDSFTKNRIYCMNYTVAYKRVENAMKSEAKTADLRGTGLINTCALRRIQRKLRYTNHDFFNVAAEYKINYGSDGNIGEIRLYYHEKRSESQDKLNIYEKEIKKICANASNYDSDLKKAIAVHDYICIHYEFDRRYYDKEYEVRKIAVCDSVNMAVQKKGVCEGYAEMFCDCMTRLGIENTVAFNSDHVWNVIKICGQWYNIDLTWDDKTPDCYARVFHEHMIKSDKGLSKKHKPWYCDVRCRDKTYDFAPWKDAYSPLVINGNDIYMIIWHTNNVMCYNINSDRLKNIYSADRDCHCGLGLYKGKLYFNTKDKIYSMELKKPYKKSKIFSYTKEDIISLTIDGSSLSCATGSYNLRAEKQIEIDLKKKRAASPDSRPIYG